MDVMLPDATPRVMDDRKGHYFDIDRRCKPETRSLGIAGLLVSGLPCGLRLLTSPGHATAWPTIGARRVAGQAVPLGIGQYSSEARQP